MLRRIVERTLLLVSGLFLALIVLEAAARFGMIGGGVFSADELREAMQAQASDTGSRPGNNHAGEYQGRILEVIHPYLGFVPDPSAFEDRTTIADPGQILPPSDDSLIVGLFGGSFALGVCRSAGDEIRRVLARPGKTVRLLCLAAGGYKQPQHFLALAYLLAQGGHLDLAINLDGFNEVALPPENLAQSVAPIYPRSWLWRIGNVSDASALKLLGELSIVDGERREWADRFLDWRSDRSALLSVVWHKLDRRYAARRDGLVAAIQSHKVEQRKGYVQTGPKMTFANPQALDAYLVRLWRDASMQMKLLCDVNQVEYVHFLQPNQYVVGSKPLAPEEVRLATDHGVYRRAGEQAYPILRQHGDELRKAGVRFHDLTMVFGEVAEPLYSDGCCHLNPTGYAMIARTIGERVRADTAHAAAVATQP
jgi:hypothetical protein